MDQRARIRDLLGAHARGEDRLPEIVHIHRNHRHEIEALVVLALGATHGLRQERLSWLAAALGMVEQWYEQAQSDDPAIRAEAEANISKLAFAPSETRSLFNKVRAMVQRMSGR